MSLPLSRELGAVIEKAGDIADGAGQNLSTAHMLVAMFEVPNQAATLLTDRSVVGRRLRQQMEHLDGEAAHLVDRVRQRSLRLADGSRAEAVGCLHLLAAMTRESSSDAYALLESSEVDIRAIRTAVMSYAVSPTGSSDGGESQHNNHRASAEGDGREPSRTASNGPASTSIGFHPSLGVGTNGERIERRRSGEEQQRPHDGSERQAGDGDGDRPTRESTSQSAGEPLDERRARLQRLYRNRQRPDGGSSKRRSEQTTSDDGEESKDQQNQGARDLQFGDKYSSRETGEIHLDLDSHPGINRGGRPRRSYEQHDESTSSPGGHGDPTQASSDGDSAVESDAGDDERRRAEAMEQARETTQDLAKRLFSDGPSESLNPRVGDDADGDDPVVAPELADDYRLDSEAYPNLAEYGRNLTVEAAVGDIDRVIGREAEIGQLIDILGKRRANNPLLVGEPGVGKTAIVEGLARQIVEMKQQGRALGNRTIIELEMSRLLSGTHLRGAFSERLLGIKDEVADAGGQIVVFLDEIHMWMSAGSGGDGGDAAGELKTALARGRFPCVGATTHDEFRQFVESDPAFERRFQQVTVDEPDEQTALRIVEGVRTHYERHHGVAYTPGALAASVTLSGRYIHDRQLPDKAIGVLDLAGSRAARRGHQQVDRQTLAAVVADMASIPVDRLTGSDGDRFLNMESFLSEGIVGHDQIVTTISELLRRNYAGFRGDRPIGSLLFLGPTGVGKTEMVKVLADFLFHDRDAVVQIDMSEFMEAHSVSRLIGSPPGYVGHDQGGQLTEKIRQRPYQVVLLDEIEKAHSDILNLLLQLFEEGRLTDGRGREVDFSNALVVMTSNLGADVFDELEVESTSSSIGFSRRDNDSAPSMGPDDAQLRDGVLDAANEHFTPELWNRIDEKLVFTPLSRDEIAEIAKLQLADSQQKLRSESDIEMDYEAGVIEHLIEHGGYNRKLGARPMRQTIQRLVEGEVAREILAGNVDEGGRIVVGVEGGDIVVRATH